MSHIIKIEDYQFEQRIPKMSEDFDAVLDDECDVLSFTFDNNIGSGIIGGMNFDYGMSFMSVDMNAKQTIAFDYHLGRRHPVSFIYVLDGSVELTNSLTDAKVTLSKSETAIYAPNGDASYQINFPTKSNVKIVICSVIRFLFLRKIECDLDTMPYPLREMFKDTTGENQFIYTSGSNPLSLEISNFKLNSKEELVEQKLLFESRTLKLLTTLLKNFRVEKQPQESGYRFTSYDIKNINLAKNIIVDNIANVPTTKRLSLQVGINVNKLQKGFHMIFGKSIRQFIISFRMHLALSMMDDGDRSISEIAHEIGYINKGHFAILFKKEFGILPKEYRSSSKSYIQFKNTQKADL